MAEARKVPVGDAAVTALVYAAPEPAGCTLVLGHGAGAPQRSPFMVAVAEGLARAGVDAVTFDFLYTEAGRKAPDPAPKLVACFRAVVSAVRADARLGRGRLLVGGKSMGGRMASMLAAEGEPVDGVVLLGYPLHPPKQPDKPRTAHLPKIRAPMLFVQGARDAFGTEAELRPVLDTLSAPVELMAIPDGDHSFAVPKRSGRTADVLAEVIARVAAFCQKVTVPSM